MRCKVCGIKADSDYCFRHKPRKRLKISSKPKRKPKLTVHSDEPSEMVRFFMWIWSRRPHKSEISGDSLGKHPMSSYFHHILPKSKYPQLEFKEDNIILLTLQEHDNVEMDMYRYPEINKRREKLIKKYLE